MSPSIVQAVELHTQRPRALADLLSRWRVEPEVTEHADVSVLRDRDDDRHFVLLLGFPSSETAAQAGGEMHDERYADEIGRLLDDRPRFLELEEVPAGMVLSML